MKTTKQRISAPDLAAEYGISVNKVHAWIEAGELVAINIATKTNGRPRFSIRREDIETFELARQVQPAAPTPKKPRSRTTMKIKSFI